MKTPENVKNLRTKIQKIWKKVENYSTCDDVCIANYLLNKRNPGPTEEMYAMYYCCTEKSKIISEKLSVRAAEDLAKQRKTGVKKVKLKDPDTIDLENNLTAKLGLSVSIDHKGKKGGSIKIEYKSLDQLEMVTSKLKI